MLVSYKIKNFKSFQDDAVLSMKCSKVKNNKESLIETPYGCLLKTLSIYGSNSSGKSNLLESFAFFKFIVLKQNIDSEKFSNVLKYKKYAYNSKLQNEPIEFTVEFTIDKNLYSYSLKVNDNGIEYESLSLKKSYRSDFKNIFIRNNQIVDVDKSFFEKEYRMLFDALRPSQFTTFISLISNVDFFQSQYLKEVYNWISNIYCFTRLDGNIEIDRLYDEMNEEELNQSLDEHKKFLNYCDIHINDLKANRKSISDHVSIYTINKNEKNENIELPFSYESEGTRKLLLLYNLMFDKIITSSLFVIDEMDNKLNPILFEKLLETFKKRGINKKNVQLIHSTHSLGLLVNRDNFRTDEIVFVDKNKKGSKVSVLKDKNVMNNNSIIKQYYKGLYGGIPKINTEKELDI